ncbi:MAG: Frizzy aggregation protein FrzB [Myxococcaceae bacterium]
MSSLLLADPGDDTARSLELLLFEVGDEVYGADATQVLRIDKPADDALTLVPLGELKRGSRALVFRTQSGEGQLRVDRVRGVASAGPNTLRRLPPAARRLPCAIGVWLAEDRPILLLDLVQTLTSQGRS